MHIEQYLCRNRASVLQMRMTLTCLNTWACSATHSNLTLAVLGISLTWNMWYPFQCAVKFTPHGHICTPGLPNNLSNAFKSRFGCTGDLSDLENALSNFQCAVELTPHGHAHMPPQLNNLGSGFESHFGCTGDLADLENAISNLQCAVELISHGHAHMPPQLNNLGSALKSCFDCSGNLTDVENAIFNFQHAVELTPHGYAQMLYFFLSTTYILPYLSTCVV